jgi:hypothetical protein
MEPTRAVPYDPLRFCIFTTIALLAWLVGPPLMVAAMAGLGLWAYARARRQGLAHSRCVLGDTRLVMGYLAAAGALGLLFTVRSIIR